MAIRFDNVTFNEVKSLNLKLVENEIIGVISESEYYKNTFFNLILGNIKDVSGKITIDRLTVSSKKYKDKISYYKNNEELLYLVNIKSDIKNILKDYSNTKLEELFKLFNLNIDILKKHYSELSKSEYKKIIIILQLLQDRKVIILDNPTVGLDTKSINNLIKILKREKKEKVIIVFSYDSNFLLQLSDRLCVIKKDYLIVDNKYMIFKNIKLIESLKYKVPDIIKFQYIALKDKNIKLLDRDNINDLIKDIYRSAR